MSRTAAQFQVKTKEGRTRTITVVDAVTPDDLVRVGLKAYVNEKRAGIPYGDPFSEDIRDLLVTSRIGRRR